MIEKMENVYTLTNHDWLHQLTGPAYLIPEIFDTDLPQERRDEMIAWRDKLPSLDDDYTAHFGPYEAWAIKLHADLLNMPEAADMMQELEETLDSSVECLQQMAQELSDNPKKQSSQKAEISYLADTMARALRFIEYPDQPLTQRFLTNVAKVMTSDVWLSKRQKAVARNTVGNPEEKLVQEMTDALINSNIVTKVFAPEANTDQKNQMMKESTLEVVKLMQGHYRVQTQMQRRPHHKPATNLR